MESTPGLKTGEEKIKELQTENDALRAQSLRDKEEIANLRQMVGGDSLLNDLLNRTFATSILGSYISQLNSADENRREGRKPIQVESLMVLYADIDGLKLINDTYGHGVGDKAILTIGKRIKSVTRPEDPVFRMGGDEFMVILPFGDSGANFQDVFQRIKEKVEKDLFIEVEEEDKKRTIKIPLTISMGFEKVEKGKAQSADSIIAIADQKMYKEKRSRSSNGAEVR